MVGFEYQLIVRSFKFIPMIYCYGYSIYFEYEQISRTLNDDEKTLRFPVAIIVPHEAEVRRLYAQIVGPHLDNLKLCDLYGNKNVIFDIV